MKYLKTYKIFESSNSELELEVKDMFLELEDLGFSVDVVMSPQGLDMWILQATKNRPFKWSDVSDTFERAKEYIESNSSHWVIDKYCVSFVNDDKENFRLDFDRYQKFVEFVSLEVEIYEICFIFDFVK